MLETMPGLNKLDQLLIAIGHCSPPDEVEFAQEHINEARTYLLGAMPGEFGMSLELARESLSRMDDTATRQEAQKLLATISRIHGTS